MQGAVICPPGELKVLKAARTAGQRRGPMTTYLVRHVLTKRLFWVDRVEGTQSVNVGDTIEKGVDLLTDEVRAADEEDAT